MPDKTRCTLEIATPDQYGITDEIEVDEVESLDYSSDVLALGDQCHVTIVNHRRKYRDELPIGALVRIWMSHPAVHGNARTLKFLGRIIERKAETSGRGSLVKLTVADLGWHLQKCCAPLWFNLRHGRYAELCDPSVYRVGRNGEKKYFIDPSFGIKGVRFDNDINRSLKQGVIVAKTQTTNDLAVLCIQVEPGDAIIEKIQPYLKRLNLLANVSVDGFFQCWDPTPSYSRPAKHYIRNRAGDISNNVIDAHMVESAQTMYTDVECVGEQIAWEGESADNANPNATKKRGVFQNPKLLPYRHRITFPDQEMYSRELAQKAAAWKYKRGLFDSWYVQYRVEGHHQGGEWWEADTMCDVQDEELGISGPLYVASVRCESNRSEGDVTTLILRKPGLLSASFGIMPNAPTIKSSPPAAAAGGGSGATLVQDAHRTLVVTE